MPPFDRHSKTPAPSKPVSGFDAPANSRKIARAPWEREDDDEFGPPPALDLSPGDAEAEAKRMVYETKHPLNAALMQNAHFDHNRAMRRYAALARRAWDPAARDIPVQPARVIGDDDVVRSVTSTPSMPKVAAHPGLSKDATANVPPRALLVGGRSEKSRPHPAQIAEADRLMSGDGAEPPRPQDFGRRGELPSRLSESDLSFLPANVLADRAEGIRQAQQRVLAAQRGAESASLPPYAIPYSTFLQAKEAIEVRDDFSDSTKYLLLGLIGFEDLTHDTAGTSSGGITATTLANYRQFASAFRQARGDDAITAESVGALSTDELLDLQYVYLVVELDPYIEFPVRENFKPGQEGDKLYQDKVAEVNQLIAASNVLDQIGTGAIAFQIADCVFNYKPANGTKILQSAFNSTITRMSDEHRRANGYAALKIDGRLGEDTFASITALANDSQFGNLFLDWIRIKRMQHTVREDKYTGNNRLRIWGVSQPHAGG